ncbi:hypothetical protein IKE_05877 [Bacillus cereus VD196]|uniref:Uncharacterized protein n=1 Tax=Bacillus cereus VD196 TaxID=1053243 RepID=A0A9W5PYF8_BACCE|nr:hypothetical protein [Bacillus cereus]EJR93386.1 hypothetical protein IKG_05502 [Bacillus cereus VD200]EOO61603.1 hypothetical protein IKE_05877 [Bacillus cereus VD196]
MKTYNINQLACLKNLDLEVVVSSIKASEYKAKNIGRNMDVNIILKSNYLEILLDEEINIIQDFEHTKYQFRIFTNNTLISCSKLNEISSQEKISLLQKESYMDTEGKFVTVEWTLSEVYELLHLKFPDFDDYVFKPYAHLVIESI